MDDFFQRYQSFIMSVLYLTTAVLVAGYATIYSTRANNIDEINAAYRFYVAENKKLENVIKKHKEAQKKAGTKEDGINSLPAFLRRINDIANETEVIIQKLIPDDNNPFRFTLEIIDDYFKFVKFSSRLESLNVNIHDIQVHPYDLGQTPPLHAISFSLTPRADAEPLSSKRIYELRERVAKKDKRNPFQRFAYSAKQMTVRPEIDLTWVNKLSSVGKAGRIRYATIDGTDYSEGDEFRGMKIINIESDRVYLNKKTPNGLEKYQLKFRRTKKKKK